ncbi:DUF1549 domain-containing protein [Tundrisphaera sp. TA3]|uniref:DUF1549 domain-containing protein n=1 Tax=Tundrisphaera sp. TA3 TaxID=3435775 RepID=UPI003EBF8683
MTNASRGRAAVGMATLAVIWGSFGAAGSARGADGAGKDAKPAEAAKAPVARAVPAPESAALDALIEKGLAANKTPLASQATDEEYIRRLYLDVLGSLPTPGSIRQFVTSRDRNKRAALIEALLDHPDYSRNWARYWRDVIAFRSPNENPRQLNWALLVDWLAEQLDDDRPWDEIARSIITATGRDDENGAVVFALSEEAKAPEMAGEVSRVFLGIQIQCAECHDHPSDPWKRQQFHEFAAFFAGVKSRRVEKPEPGKRQVFEVAAKGAPKYTMVDLKDPKKQIPVVPKFFLGDEPALSHAVKADRRLELAADYVASPKNPWFARAFVNRVWFCLMGEGFYNPVDDMGPTREAASPEVLDLLAKKWEATGYDIRWLFRTILNTKAYQRAARSSNTAAGRTAFASICPSRLRADQIYDALAHALDLGYAGPAQRPRAMAKAAKAARAALPDQPKEVQDAAAAKLLADRNNQRRLVDDVFGVDPSVPPDTVMGTIPQALFMMNGPMVTRGVKARPDSMLGKLLSSTPDNRAVLDALYLRVLARRPNPKEVAACGRYFQACPNRIEAFEDILWALVNSTEFISRR